MAKLPPICDVPGCGAHRKRFQRTCDDCFRRLPGDIKVGLTEAHHQRRMADWRALRKRAAAFLGLGDRTAGAAPTPPHRNPVTPQRAFELQARMLGER